MTHAGASIVLWQPRARHVIATTLLLILMGTAAGAMAQAAGPINTDRPGFTETAHIIGVGTFQLEFGYTIDREDGSTLHNVGEGVLRYGLNERVELRVGLPSYAWYQGRASGSGAGDPWLGFKVRVVDGDPGMGIDRPDIAVETFFTVPAGGSFGSDEVTPNIYLIYAWNLSETMVLAGNVFYANLVAGDERFSQYVASLSVTQALSSEIAAYYEYFRYFRRRLRFAA